MARYGNVTRAGERTQTCASRTDRGNGAVDGFEALAAQLRALAARFGATVVRLGVTTARFRATTAGSGDAGEPADPCFRLSTADTEQMCVS
jgi:hypothetical protein